MENQSSILTITIISVSLLVALSPTALLHMTSVFGQNNITSSEEKGAGGTGGQTLHITKDATNSYTISSGASFVGSFDTTYSVVGGVSPMDASKDLIVSTITEDFGTSSTIGYVNNTSASGSQANPTQLTLLNPFATKEDIDEKIRNEITASIGNAVKSNFTEVEIKCIFGSSLDDFKCGFHGLISS
ncbi:hypothetical protein BH18THE2_BH18THE2_06710 [soil metagenome]